MWSFALIAYVVLGMTVVLATARGRELFGALKDKDLASAAAWERYAFGAFVCTAVLILWPMVLVPADWLREKKSQWDKWREKARHKREGLRKRQDYDIGIRGLITSSLTELERMKPKYLITIHVESDKDIIMVCEELTNFIRCLELPKGIHYVHGDVELAPPEYRIPIYVESDQDEVVVREELSNFIRCLELPKGIHYVHGDVELKLPESFLQIKD